MESPVSSMHIGILCDYGFTLLPKSGIGVFVYNLIDGLLTLSPPPQITLLTHPGDQEGLAECAERWQDRVRILPPPEESRTTAVRIENWLTALRQRCLDLEFVVSSRWIRVISKQKQQVLARLKREWQAWRSSPERPSCKAEVRNPGIFGRMIFWALVLGAGSWTAEIFQSLTLGFLVPTLLFPLHLTHRVFLAMRGSVQPLDARMAAAQCDVWLVPFPGTQTPILAPHVLVIFDMVFRHVPEVYSDSERDHFQHLFSARAREATLIYCGSNFVKEHDLLPCFPSAADRIRVFRLAPPLDLQPEDRIPDLNTLSRKYRIRSRFLFYPAALRAHKNHATLVRALKILHQMPGYSDLALVFTGEGRQSPELLRLVHSEGLTESVHFLGIVDRQDIQAFYRQALLVPLPSLHEGYGLPLLEALQNQCPVVCADVPAFRELLEGHNDAVLFFDPRDPNSIVQAVSLTIARRQELRDRQRDAYRQIARRDWHAVAQDFLHIFEEAHRLGTAIQRPSLGSLSAAEETIHHAA
jgi:glycosyltransferase involved in cell wall biosynthesis